jgi:hypothetical protein
MSEISKQARLIDGNKLMNWIGEEKEKWNMARTFGKEVIFHIESGEFDSSPSDQGEAARLREPVQWFAEQMEHTLRRNDHKGGWQDMSFDDLLERLHEEVEELSNLPLEHDVTVHRIIRECTDVANFAMMIADCSKRAAGITIPGINSDNKSEYQRGWDAAMAQSEAEPIADKMVRDFERKREVSHDPT